MNDSRKALGLAPKQAGSDLRKQAFGRNCIHRSEGIAMLQSTALPEDYLGSCASIYKESISNRGLFCQ